MNKYTLREYTSLTEEQDNQVQSNVDGLTDDERKIFTHTYLLDKDQPKELSIGEARDKVEVLQVSTNARKRNLQLFDTARSLGDYFTNSLKKL